MISALLRVFVMADAGTATSLATVTVAGLLLLAAAYAFAATGLAARTSSPARVRTTLRERTLRTAFLPQRDPDAAGRPRPRAPGLKIVSC